MKMVKQNGWMGILFVSLLTLWSGSEAQAAKVKDVETSPKGGVVLTVVAASDLKFALDEEIRVFSKKFKGVPIRATYGSSGTFAAQIMQNAPYDLYFSADLKYPKALIEKDLVLGNVQFPYAIGRLALWVPSTFKGDLEKLGLQALTNPEIRHIAIANPQHAPYGRAAVEALTSVGLFETLQRKLVYGENVAQAAQFAQSSSAQAGLIALSLALSPELQKSGRYWIVPPHFYGKLEQSGVIMKRTQNLRRASAFRDFILGKEGRAILAKYGFLPPEN